jgi:hypothetical protein
MQPESKLPATTIVPSPALNPVSAFTLAPRYLVSSRTLYPFNADGTEWMTFKARDVKS